MQPPDDYSLGKCLRGGAESEVYAATRLEDGRAVVLKSALGTCPAEARARARTELAALRQAAGPGVVQALGLHLDGPAPILVLDAIPGISLGEWAARERPGVEAGLEIALQLSAALSRVHRAGLLHLDLRPDHVMIEPDSRTLQLIDFARARPLGAPLESRRGGPPRAADAATLRFRAPEQSARTDRGADARSDLYALGGLLYWMLTGAPPFRAHDPGSLIRAHLAALPLAPHELRPELPEWISHIALRLLEKDPEDRPADADALHAELERALDAVRDGSPAADRTERCAPRPSDRLRLTDRLQGREREATQLRDAWHRAASGRRTAVLISGPAGSGRSALLRALHEPLLASQGLLARGRFAPQRSQLPYSGFAQTLCSLAAQLTWADEPLARQRRALESLRPVAGALVALAPGLEPLWDEIPRLPPLESSACRARLAYALEGFLGAFATPHQPLAIALEGLEWIDPASAELLDALLRGPASGAVLWIASCRDDALASGTAMPSLFSALEQEPGGLTRIALGPLSRSACAEWVADALGESPARVRELAAPLLRESGGLPGALRCALLGRVEQGRIRFDASAGGWEWDEPLGTRGELAAVRANAIPGELQGAAAQLLECASALGDPLDPERLERASGLPREEVVRGIDALGRLRLWVPGWNGMRFEPAALRATAKRLDPERSAQIHLRALHPEEAAARPESWSESLDEAELWIAAERALESSAQRERASAALAGAGMRSLACGAAAAAKRYLEAAQRIAPETRALPFEALANAAEAARQVRDFEAARGAIDALERTATRPMEHAAAAALRALARASEIGWERALPEALAPLAGPLRRIPARPGRRRARLSAWWTDRCLRGARLGPPGPARSPSALAALLPAWFLLGAPVAAGSRLGSNLALLGLSRLLRALHRSGGAIPALALAAFAAARIARGEGPRERLQLYAETASRWSLQPSDPVQTPRVQALLLAQIYPLQRPRRGLLEPMQQCAEQLLQVGERAEARALLEQRLAQLALVGEPLEQVRRECEAFCERIDPGAACATARSAEALWRLAAGPQAPAERDASIARLERALRAAPEAELGAWAVWLLALWVGAREPALLEAFRSLPPAVRERVRGGGALAADLWLAYGMAAAACERRPQRVLLESLRRLEQPGARGPDAAHMALALRAELARARRRPELALRLYAEAAEAALRQGHRHHGALIHERRAELLAQLGRSSEATRARGRAEALYQEWGAIHRVHALQQRARQLADPGAPER